jgi:hypothetical protein
MMALSLCVYDAVVYHQRKLQFFIKIIIYIKILFILLILPKKNKNLLSAITRGDHFSSVRFLSKKITKPNILFKKNETDRNRFKSTGFGSVF